MSSVSHPAQVSTAPFGAVPLDGLAGAAFLLVAAGAALAAAGSRRV